jgi:predicted nucleotidyltransferase
MVAQEVIEAAGQTLVAVADDPVKIVLFGSRARGDAGPDSDFDFLVVERDPRNRHDEMVRLGRALRPLGMPFDVIVVSERYAEDWGAWREQWCMPPHDRLELARVLLARAVDDETLVRKVCSDADVADSIVGFHAQQASEKLIKAVLAARGVTFVKSHALSYLIGLV